MTLPDYQLRVSSRAKRLQLKVTPHGGLEVVVPQRFDQRQVPEFLRRHRHWIEKALGKAEAWRRARPDLHESLPATIVLPALEHTWGVSYGNEQRRLLREHQGNLLLRDADVVKVRHTLGSWLNDLAKASLVPWLRQLSLQLELPFNDVRVRAQKTRWGSCSAKGNINLNRNLLFLRPELVRYLFIHELCHTRYLNHSPAYWRLVEEVESDFRELERELTHAVRLVPAWAMPD